MTNTQKWTEERVATLLAGTTPGTPVTAEAVKALSDQLEVSERSVAAKLRNLDVEVESTAKSTQPTFTEDEATNLAALLSDNENQLTYAEIAAKFMDGKFTSKQVQGKILSMELTGLVKPSEKAEVPRTYTEAEEATLISMCLAGNFIEDIAEALGKTANSVRGKALSLLRSGEITKIPLQKESHAKNEVDPIDALGDTLGTMTVAEIAVATSKSERGIKTTLTRRGLVAKDYDGQAKKAKNEAKSAE